MTTKADLACESLNSMLEAHKLASIIKKNGFNVVKVPKTVNDLFDAYQKTSPDRECFTDDGKFSFHFYNGSMTLTELDNALLIGKKCKEYRVSWMGSDPFPVDLVNAYMKTKFTDFLKDITSGETDVLTEYGTQENFRFNSGDTASKDVFSPFALGNLKRVKSLPSKINLRHVMRLLANGQFSILRSDYSYTDDYAYDNATDFGKADNLDPIALLMKMFKLGYNKPYSKEDKKGNTVISFGAHSNDSNTLVVDLNAKLKYKA